MHPILRQIPALMAMALPAMAADAPMTGAAFEAYVTGHTLTFSSQGQVYGAEQYLPGRRVKWAFTEDICRDGVWYEEAGQICFVYDYDPVPQCWLFWNEGGLSARFMGEESGTELREISRTTGPLPCSGPEVGV